MVDGPVEGEPWMTKQRLAATLGCSVRWLEYRVAEGMPHRVFGGRLRFQRGVVEAWLDARAHEARHLTPGGPRATATGSYGEGS